MQPPRDRRHVLAGRESAGGRCVVRVARGACRTDRHFLAGRAISRFRVGSPRGWLSRGDPVSGLSRTPGPPAGSLEAGLDAGRAWLGGRHGRGRVDLHGHPSLVMLRAATTGEEDEMGDGETHEDATHGVASRGCVASLPEVRRLALKYKAVGVAVNAMRAEDGPRIFGRIAPTRAIPRVPRRPNPQARGSRSFAPRASRPSPRAVTVSQGRPARGAGPRPTSNGTLPVARHAG
jgi:hypothetical protein